MDREQPQKQAVTSIAPDETRPQIDIQAMVERMIGGEFNVLKNPTWNAARDIIIQFVVQRFAADGIVAFTKEELEQAQADYLDYVIATSAPLEWKGYAADKRPKETPLDCLYVTLTAEREVENPLKAPVESGFAKEGSEREATSVDRASEGRRRENRIEKADLHQALTKCDRLVILGDPGAGKTTLARFLALRFAEACRDGKDEVVDNAGNCFGFTRIPICVTVADFVKHWTNTAAPALDSVLAACAKPKSRANAAIAALLQTAIRTGTALILFDGLDEVTNPDTRRDIAKELALIARDPTNRNPMVVTSRIAGYQEAQGISGFTPYTLSELSPEQQRHFIEQWYAYYEPQLPGEIDDTDKLQRAGQKAEWLLDGIRNIAGVERFAANPLMLTLLCMVAEPNTPLPTRRAELYARCSKTLLREWNKGKPDPNVRTITEWQEKHLLPPLAYAIHVTGTNGKVSTEDVLSLLRPILAKLDNVSEDDEVVWQRAVDFWNDLLKHTGLFAQYSLEQYGFIHLTFQEYYAARYLTYDVKVAQQCLYSHRHQARWEEVIRLTVAFQHPAVAASLIRHAIMPRGMRNWLRGWRCSKYDRYLQRDLLLAARCLSDCEAVEPMLEADIVGELLEICLYRNGMCRMDPLVQRARKILRLLRNTQAGTRAQMLLAKALNDRSGFVRMAAAKALEKLEQASTDVVAPLLQALKDEDSAVRRTAAEALGRVGKTWPRVVQVLLLIIVSKDPHVRQAAVQALGSLGQVSPKVMQALLKALKDESSHVRDDAWEALDKLVQIDTNVAAEPPAE